MIQEPISPDLLPIIQPVLDNPDAPDHQALITALGDEDAAGEVASLAPEGTFAQVAAALSVGMPFPPAGWERHIDKLVDLITDQRWISEGEKSARTRIISSWSDIPSAVGVLADRFEELAPWANCEIPAWTKTEFIVLFGPSEKAAVFMPDFFGGYAAGVGTTIRLWSMAASSEDLTAWQAQISREVLKELREKASPSYAFPAWGADDDEDVSEFAVRYSYNYDLAMGWSPDHVSINVRYSWLEREADRSSVKCR